MKRVLIVEDDPLQQKLLRNSLKDNGYEINFCDSGDKALANIIELPPDLIVLDLVLPNVDGYQVLDQLEQNQQMQAIPLIVFTNISKQEIKDSLLERGINEFLIKSEVTLEELNTAIKKYLNET